MTLIAVEEILAERPLPDRVAEIAVRGGDDADVDRALDVRSDPADHAVLQDTQQLDLHRRGRIADLVEKDRPAVGFVEQAALLADRSGERAPLVAEELGFQEVLGKRAAVDGDELAAAPPSCNESPGR